ncbi:MAG TPA: hypothetical protein VN807_06085, partial [Candidatus Sulfotelmatobacter sp.]|nr:hypothetical protein [Candidatus Sulfotelmatobacter sp.]
MVTTAMIEESRSEERSEKAAGCKPALAAIFEAQRVLAGYFRATPLVRAGGISRPGADAYLKLEAQL